MVDTISGSVLSTHTHFCPPIEYSGRVYILVRDSGANDNDVEVWSNTQPLTDSWVNKGTWDTTNDNAIAWTKNGSKISIVSMSGTDDVDFREWDMDTDAWAADELELLAQSAVSTTVQWVDIAAKSNGDLCVVFAADEETISHTDYARVGYLFRVSGTWDTSVNALDDGGTVDYNYPVVTQIGGDYHFAYYDGTDIQHKSYVSSLSSAETCNDTTVASTPIPIIGSYNAGAVERVVVGWTKSSNTRGFVSFIDDDATPAAEQDAAGDTTALWQFSADDTNDEIAIIYSKPTDTMRLARYTGTWANSEIQTSAAMGFLGGAAVYDNDDGDTVVGYYWQVNAATDVKYDEFVLQTGGTFQDVATALDFAVSLTESGDFVQDVVTTLSGDATITEVADFYLDRVLLMNASASITSAIDLLWDVATALAASVSITESGEHNWDVVTALAASATLTETGDFIRDIVTALSANLTITEAAELRLDVATALAAAVTLAENAEHIWDVATALAVSLSLSESGDHVRDIATALALSLTITESADFFKDIVTALAVSATITEQVNLGGTFQDVVTALAIALTLAEAGEQLNDTATALDANLSITESGDFVQDVVSSLLFNVSIAENGDFILESSANLAVSTSLITLQELLLDNTIILTSGVVLTSNDELLRDTAVSLLASGTIVELAGFVKDDTLIFNASVSITAAQQIAAIRFSITEAYRQDKVSQVDRLEAVGRGKRGAIN